MKSKGKLCDSTRVYFSENFEKREELNLELKNNPKCSISLMQYLFYLFLIK